MPEETPLRLRPGWSVPCRRKVAQRTHALKRALIKALDAGRTEAARLRAKAAAVRAAAWAAFEGAVYAAEPEATPEPVAAE